MFLIILLSTSPHVSVTGIDNDDDVDFFFNFTAVTVGILYAPSPQSTGVRSGVCRGSDTPTIYVREY